MENEITWCTFQPHAQETKKKYTKKIFNIFLKKISFIFREGSWPSIKFLLPLSTLDFHNGMTVDFACLANFPNLSLKYSTSFCFLFFERLLYLSRP